MNSAKYFAHLWKSWFKKIKYCSKCTLFRHILALCKHCRAEPDSHDILDGRSELADFRSKAQESVKDVVRFG